MMVSHFESTAEERTFPIIFHDNFDCATQYHNLSANSSLHLLLGFSYYICYFLGTFLQTFSTVCYCLFKLYILSTSIFCC